MIWFDVGRACSSSALSNFFPCRSKAGASLIFRRSILEQPRPTADAPSILTLLQRAGLEKFGRSAWSFRWLMRLWAFGLVTATCALDARSTAIDCISCVEMEGSWQLDSCHTEDLGDCPIADADCCTNAECCVTSGCRSPEDMLVENPFAHPVSCHRCCEESPEGCKFRTYVDGAATYSEPHYNVEEIAPGKNCADVWPDPSVTCPPCAYCDLHTEQGLLQRLSECNCEMIHADCREETSCECYCQKQAQGLVRCPHLLRRLRSEL